MGGGGLTVHHWHSPLPLPPTSQPPLSRPTMLPSPSSRTSPPMEPRPSMDQSEPTRPSASQSFMRPELTPSRPSAKLSTPQSTLLARSQLLLSMLPQLLLLLEHMLLPQLLLPVTVMLLPQLLLLVTVMLVLSTELTLLPQLLLNKCLNNPNLIKVDMVVVNIKLLEHKQCLSNAAPV